MKTCYLTFNHCERRVLEERRLRNFLAANGFREVDDPTTASAAIFLACGMLDEQSTARLQDLVEKRKGRTPPIVFGCYCSMTRQQLTDAVHVPLTEPAGLDVALGATVGYGSIPYPPTVESPQRFDQVRRHWDPRLLLPHASDVYSLRISNGCSEECAYCTIRQATGPLRSRPVAEVIADLQEGLARGFTVFRLQCENLGVYGKDIGVRLGDLLSALAAVPQPFKVDLPDLHPSGLLDSFDEILALLALDRVLLVHLPMQSANPRILELMRRRYDVSEVDRRLSELRTRFPDVPVGTDIIAGFPTETEEEFEDSAAFLRRHRFDWVYLHGYAPKQGAAASALGLPVPWRSVSARIAKGFASVPNVLCYLNDYSLADVRADATGPAASGAAAEGVRATSAGDPTVDVLLCAGEGDVYRLLGETVEACATHFELLGKIVIVTDAKQAVEDVLASSVRASTRARIQVRTDQEVLSPAAAHLPGWSRQQAIKLLADEICGSQYVACLGADCIMCKPIRAEHLFADGRPILYYTKYPGGEKHHEYERGRLANVARTLQVDPVRSGALADFVMDFMIMERQILRRLRAYLRAIYGEDPFPAILPSRCETLEQKQQCGEQTLYAAFLLDVLRADVRLENSANRFVAQVHSRRDFDRFHFDAHAVHFVDKSLEVAAIRHALGLPPR